MEMEVLRLEKVETYRGYDICKVIFSEPTCDIYWACKPGTMVPAGGDCYSPYHAKYDLDYWLDDTISAEDKLFWVGYGPHTPVGEEGK